MTTTPTTTATRRPRILEGEVVRRSGDKTVAVAVHSVKMHPVYHKRSRVTKVYLTHDPKNTAQVGDQVQIREYRPLSRHKRWILVTTAA